MTSIKDQKYLYFAFERIWHWLQAIFIVILAITGFEIHASYTLFGFENAIIFHNTTAILLIILSIIALLWHFTTGLWTLYLPTNKTIKTYILFYLKDIFQNKTSPSEKSLKNKLNPLQKITYFLLVSFLIPLMIISGLLYLLYRYPFNGEIKNIAIQLDFIAYAHTIGAFAIVAFIIIHLYLITTGAKPTTYLKEMITGYEENQSNKSDSKNTVN